MQFSNAYVNLEKSVRFGASKRRRALAKIASFVDAGINLPEALRQMSRFASQDGRDPRNYSARVYARWQRMVASGRPLAESMRGYIPEAERQMITAAEKYGKLADGIRKAITISDGMRRIRNSVMKSIGYPLVLFAAIIIFMVFMQIKIFPGFYESLDRNLWPESTSSLETVSSFVTNYLVLILMALAALTALFSYSLPRWTGPVRDALDEYVPYNIYKTIFGTVFLLSIAGYVKAGMNTPEILQTMIKGSSPWYREKLKAILAELGKGAKDLGEALSKTGMDFPNQEVIEDLRTFAKQKGFEEALDHMGNTILEESIQRIETQAKVMNYASLFAVAAVILWFVGALFDFSNAITAAASAPG